MPTQTFFNLSEDKRQNLIQCAFEEFSKKPYEEASINAIIQTAEIPRGSFYQYFEDKDDLYYFLHGIRRRKEFSQLKQNAVDNSGDIFESLAEFYRFCYFKYSNKEVHNFYQYFFKSSKYIVWRQNGPFHQDCDQKRHHDFEKDVVSMFDLTTLRLSTQEEKVRFTRYAMGLVQKTLAEVFINELSFEAGSQILAEYFKWLKYGVYQQEDTNA